MPSSDAISPSASTQARAAELLATHQSKIWRRTDRLFAGLLGFEWLVCVVLAAVMSPFTYEGAQRSIHPHLWTAILLGGVIASLPIALALTLPARTITRHAIGVAQMLMSGLLIHLGDGRIEMHFHIFGSLAFLAFYRDWRVLITASVVVAVDHLLRGIFVPETIYGISAASGWRTVEHAGWVVFEDIFLITACVQAVREMKGIALSQALLEQSHREVEQKVIERTKQLKDAQDDLVRTARTAGMAEIATSVLHNVGNVLNSVNVSATVVADKIKQSEVGTLGQVSQMITQHKSDLSTFLDRDDRGKMIPDFIAELATCLADEQKALLSEVESLTKGIDHIKHVVASQQSMAKKTDLRMPIDPAKMFDNAWKMQSPATGAETVTCIRQFADVPVVSIDEHRVMQILINLIKNARQAVSTVTTRPRQITLGLELTSDQTPRVRFSVADTGIGIAPENIDRLFAHGFTTKSEGHGFGLHGAANTARAMGGAIHVHSDGPGTGATFTLELPVSLSEETTSCSK